MLISCPHCGQRSVQEFRYRGDAAPTRPDAPASDTVDADTVQAYSDYVYLRDNPAGPIEELWFHAAGCRSWLIATRDTRTHVIAAVRTAVRGAVS